MNNLSIEATVDLLPDEAFTAYKSTNPPHFYNSNDTAKRGILNVVNTITSMEIEQPIEDAVKKKSKFSLFNKK